MSDESDDEDLVIINSDAIRGLTRWAPLAVVLSVVGGFVALSWYAYHVGTQSVKDDDLLVVEADRTPMKEKPADPGGMQFPNQDKTIFDTFAGNSTAQPPKVERVLPVPEEPLPKEADNSETSTWINEKLKNHAEDSLLSSPEKVIGKEERKQGVQLAVDKGLPQVMDTHSGDHQVIEAKVQVDADQSETYVAHKNDTPPGQALDNSINSTDKPTDADAGEETPSADEITRQKAEQLKEDHLKEEKAKEEKAKEEKKQAAAHPVDNEITVQLGAYRSEGEAIEAWNKMHLKQKELSDKEPLVIKANLGEKGIYYRLRVGGFSTTAEAKALCSVLTAKGQACILPTDK